MARGGVATFAIDVRGFGSWMKSGGKQPVDFTDCLSDIQNSLASIKTAYPDLPLFIMGESMGGAIALRFASEHPDLVDGLISSVPSGDRFKQKKTDLKVALELFKGSNKDFDIGKSIIKQGAANNKQASDWAGDPLDRMDLSPKDLIHFQEFMNDNHDAAKLVKNLPVVFVQGIQDTLVRPEGTWELFNELATPNKVFLALPSEHLIFEDTQDDSSDRKTRNFRLLSAWLFTQAKLDGNLAQLSPNDHGELGAAITKLVSGQSGVARMMLEKLALLQPKNGEVHYWLAQAYLKTQQPVLAKQEFAKSVALGKGTHIANQANDSLVQLHNDANAAPKGADPVSSISPSPDLTDGKPTVLSFYANWCEQCKNLDVWIGRAKQAFADNIKITKLDVDDSANQELVKKFKVGPIPTMVFLRKDGTLSSTVIGETNFDVMSNSITAAMH
jgi:alpha-beta hydrolase superfamily lysophospholipase/thiol-disulfide isomerase/thioredoxin